MILLLGHRLLCVGMTVFVVAWLGVFKLASAPTCTPVDFSKAVDEAGAALRKLNAETKPRLQPKMLQLKALKGWSDADYEEKTFAALQDDRIASLDARANELLARIDSLGGISPQSAIDCAKLDELTAASVELQATVKTKTAYLMNKLDGLIASGQAPARQAVVEPPKANPPPQPPATATPKAEAQKPAPRWSTTTAQELSREAMNVPAPSVAPPPPPPPVEEGYTIDEILATSEGFLGKVSSGLASVLEHAFASLGRPTAYVLGSEGGGAFLAGLRYGEGTLYLRAGGTRKVYWHGPSLGTDIGAAGSKILFLVYRLTFPDQLFSDFTGIDGSAFIVGGVGVTVLSNGQVNLAPIRAGLGLRLGANIGYIRFTPKPTWNPF
jgi:hypothetical protein